MKTKILLFFSIFLAVFGHTKSGSIEWLTEYEKGIELAKKQKKPLILYFTGSDWCPWCFKIQDEIITDEGFESTLKDSFIFVKIDFPKKTLLPREISEKNQKLREFYEVRTFPTVALVDPDAGIISKMGYLELSGEKYAQQICSSLNEFKEICASLNMKFDGWEGSLEKLYEKAKQLGCKTCIDQVYNRGIKEDPGPFFLLEKYAHKLSKGESEGTEVAELREEIMNRDPENVKGAHRRLAVLDFQARAESYSTEVDPLFVVDPLVKYIDTFGKEDLQNSWRVEMMISQYLFSKDNVTTALKHARRSYKVAPEAVRKEISDSIVYLKGQLPSS